MQHQCSALNWRVCRLISLQRRVGSLSKECPLVDGIRMQPFDVEVAKSIPQYRLYVVNGTNDCCIRRSSAQFQSQDDSGTRMEKCRRRSNQWCHQVRTDVDVTDAKMKFIHRGQERLRFFEQELEMDDGKTVNWNC
ncbi:hypothetical protein Ae201684P_005913 [Aphanomyces euteiches]|nr:hypothetical protein Ae201684P_005913 [Aphanomyces euteiches]